MDAKAKEESAAPLGVIGSLAAGFEMIGRRLWLILLPVLLDLLLWLGPRFSIAPLVDQFIAFVLTRPTPDPATFRQVAQATKLLEQFGEQSNLLSLLGAVPLLNLPSLLAQHAPGMISPVGQPTVVLISSSLAVMAWGIVLVPVGLVLGGLYLNTLARHVRALRSPSQRAQAPGRAGAGEGETRADGATTGVGRFIRVLAFAIGLLTLGVIVVPLWMLLVGAVLAMAPAVGVLVWALSIGLGGYVILHLLFVVPGVLLGGRGLLRATWESILLIHTQFPSVVGLVLLVIIIYQGLGFVWSLPPGDSWSLLVGIVGNGCIATGLTAALFVFYQERVGQLAGARQASAEN